MPHAGTPDLSREIDEISSRNQVPTLDAASLQKLIRENELREEKKRQASVTTSEGSTSYAYQSGDTAHGKLDASKIRQQEELTILQRARTNPWHLFKSGLLRRLDASGTRMETTYGDPLVRTTPFHLLPASLKDALGGQYTWASWLQHPLSGFGLHFFLKAFELGKLTGNYLVEFNQKPKIYSDGYRSPWEKYPQRFPGGLAMMLEELTTAEKMEFRPLVPEIGFRRPTPDDPRARKPKADEADYAEKLKAHNVFLMERDVYLELGYIRDDFSFLCTVITEAYGPNFFSYITRHSQDIELRKKYS